MALRGLYFVNIGPFEETGALPPVQFQLLLALNAAVVLKELIIFFKNLVLLPNS